MQHINVTLWFCRLWPILVLCLMLYFPFICRISTRNGQQIELKEQNLNLVATNEDLQKHLSEKEVKELVSKENERFIHSFLINVWYIFFYNKAKGCWVRATTRRASKGECRVSEKPTGLSLSLSFCQNRPRWKSGLTV